MLKQDKYSNKHQICNKDLVNEFLINGNYYKPFNTFYHNLQDSSRNKNYVRQNNSESQGIKYFNNQNEKQSFQPFMSERDKQGQLLQNFNENRAPQKIKQINYSGHTPSEEEVYNIIQELKKSKNNNCMFQTKLKQFLSLMHKIQQEKAVVEDISPSKNRNPIIPERLENKNLTFQQQSPKQNLVKTHGDLFLSETPKIKRQQLLTFHASQTTNSTGNVNSSGALINSNGVLMNSSESKVNNQGVQAKQNFKEQNSSEYGAYQRFITKLDTDYLKTNKYSDQRLSKNNNENNFEDNMIETSVEHKNNFPGLQGTRSSSMNQNLHNYFQKKKLKKKNYKQQNLRYQQQQYQEYYEDEQLTNNLTVSKLSQSLKNLTKFPFEINNSTKNSSNIYDHVNCPKFSPLTATNQQNYIDILENQKNYIPSIGFYEPQFEFIKQKSPSYIFLKSNKTPQTFHFSQKEQQNSNSNRKNNKSALKNNNSVQESNNEEEKETFEKFYGKMMKEVKNDVTMDIIRNYGKQIHPSGNLILKNVYNSHKELVDADQALKKKLQAAKKFFVDLKNNYKNNNNYLK